MSNRRICQRVAKPIGLISPQILPIGPLGTRTGPVKVRSQFPRTQLDFSASPLSWTRFSSPNSPVRTGARAARAQFCRIARSDIERCRCLQGPANCSGSSLSDCTRCSTASRSRDFYRRWNGELASFSCDFLVPRSQESRLELICSPERLAAFFPLSPANAERLICCIACASSWSDMGRDSASRSRFGNALCEITVFRTRHRNRANGLAFGVKLIH